MNLFMSEDQLEERQILVKAWLAVLSGAPVQYRETEITPEAGLALLRESEAKDYHGRVP